MRILFTGASSFTGYWFIREMTSLGWSVTALFQKPRGEYTGLHGQRVELLIPHCRACFGISFGSPEFMKLIQGSSWDVFCHHGATVGNYRDPDFDVVGALAANTRGLKEAFRHLFERECRRVVMTGSVFEAGEGAGSWPLRAFSPYGLSKGMTYELALHYAQEVGIPLGKFVIPNPFGPWEEQRFTAYLIKSWLKGETPSVNTPSYVRDNIPVSLLAKAYVQFVQSTASKRAPSGYVESQGAFARRVADAMAERLGVDCHVKLLLQEVFSEPQVRINTEPVQGSFSEWSEERAWDEMADYYLSAIRDGAKTAPSSSR